MSIFDQWWNRFSARRRHGPEVSEAAASSLPHAPPVDNEDKLLERQTIETIEREHTRRADDLSIADRRSPVRMAAQLKPFGYSNGQWEALKTSMQPGDELWTFTSSTASWRALAGRAGIALVRDGTIVATIITMMN